MNFMPDVATMIAYSLACFVLFVTPGPDMSLFLSRTLAGGRRHGIAAMLGAMAGCCVHTVLAAIGVSAVLAASVTAFTVLKILGAAYLAWLAFDAIRCGSALSVKQGEALDASLWRTFLIGIGINLTNPKIVLFFVTFLPQFISAGDADASAKLMFLGVYFVVFSAPLAVIMILGAERLVHILKARPKVMRIIDWCFAGIFGAFAIKILLTPAK